MINAKVVENNEFMVNLCDSELIGRELNDSVISEAFYGEEMSDEEIIEASKQATLINA